MANSNSVRIIGGQWRGRKIQFPDALGLRPTHDRVRETLFNWLMPIIGGARCLDLFAGSGALGFEALSRGAQSVLFVDSNPQVVRSLQTTASMLEATNYQVVKASIPHDTLSLQKESIDIVFLDPPFTGELLEPSINWLVKNSLLSRNAQIYIETELSKEVLPIPSTWQIIKAKKTKGLRYYLCEVSSDEMLSGRAA